jgi:hypothetical protein
LRDLRRLGHSLVRDLIAAELHIALNIAGEQDAVLRHISDQGAELLQA